MTIKEPKSENTNVKMNSLTTDGLFTFPNLQIVSKEKVGNSYSYLMVKLEIGPISDAVHPI